MRIYLNCCSKGLETDILFKSPIEFIAGINRIAVCILLCLAKGMTVSVISFCLMDNHFHLLLYGEEEHCIQFLNLYKKLTLMWIATHRGAPLNGEIVLGHWPVARDKVHEKVVYYHRNPYVAGLKTLPYYYKWSSAGLLFADRKEQMKGLTKASDLSAECKRRYMYSRVEVPDNWYFTEDGMVWPGSFIDIDFLERLFQGPGSYMFEMNNSNIDKECEREMLMDSMMLPDGDVLDAAAKYAKQMFDKGGIESCSKGERISIGMLLRKDLGCNHKQLARVLKLSPSDLKLMV